MLRKEVKHFIQRVNNYGLCHVRHEILTLAQMKSVRLNYISSCSWTSVIPLTDRMIVGPDMNKITLPVYVNAGELLLALGNGS